MDEASAYSAMLEWMARVYDDRQVTDVARRWADNEFRTVARPENNGEYISALEAAFDAGRKFEEYRGRSR